MNWKKCEYLIASDLKRVIGGGQNIYLVISFQISCKRIVQSIFMVKIRNLLYEQDFKVI